MSKKKFSNGLDSIFETSKVQEVTENEAVATTGSDTEVVEKPTVSKKSSKKFTSDLSSLFEDSFNDPKSYVENTNTHSNFRKVPIRTLSGLDVLIRETVEQSSIEFNDVLTKKRITFTIDNEKLESLKQLAKKKNVFLKDIISEIVTNYLTNRKI